MKDRIRPGNRGGSGLFKWEDVKTDKHKSNYLGASIMARSENAERRRDILWFTKPEKGARVAVNDDTLLTADNQKSLVEIERQRVKLQEQQMMNAALGLSDSVDTSAHQQEQDVYVQSMNADLSTQSGIKIVATTKSSQGAQSADTVSDLPRSFQKMDQQQSRPRASFKKTVDERREKAKSKLFKRQNQAKVGRQADSVSDDVALLRRPPAKRLRK
ncbi:hypothetical protein MIR68_009752 [Amoeboaphelidium protococcarum]|nr:hypothetical protein MIR68_009752 [Amoeboaphelidium protococcarum]